MKRKIKFRGIDKLRNEYVYGYFMEWDVKTFIIEYGKKGIPSQQIEVISETVGQNTGLYDRNGKEIYEGDIVKMIDVDFNEPDVVYFGEVVFRDGGFEAINEQDNYYINSKCEIIGNIYSNPELLEVNK